jgi:hypothetical protein
MHSGPSPTTHSTPWAEDSLWVNCNNTSPSTTCSSCPSSHYPRSLPKVSRPSSLLLLCRLVLGPHSLNRRGAPSKIKFKNQESKLVVVRSSRYPMTPSQSSPKKAPKRRPSAPPPNPPRNNHNTSAPSHRHSSKN